MDSGAKLGKAPVENPTGEITDVKTLVFTDKDYDDAMSYLKDSFSEEEMAQLAFLAIEADMIRKIVDGSYQAEYDKLISGNKESATAAEKAANDAIEKIKSSPKFQLILKEEKRGGVDKIFALSVVIQREFARKEFKELIKRSLMEKMSPAFIGGKSASFAEKIQKLFEISISRRPNYYREDVNAVLDSLHNRAITDVEGFIKDLTQNLKDALSADGLKRLILIASIKSNKDFKIDYEKAMKEVKPQEKGSYERSNDIGRLYHYASMADGHFKTIVTIFQVEKKVMIKKLYKIVGGVVVVSAVAVGVGLVKYGGLKGLQGKAGEVYSRTKEKAGEVYSKVKDKASSWKESIQNYFSKSNASAAA